MLPHLGLQCSWGKMNINAHSTLSMNLITFRYGGEIWRSLGEAQVTPCKFHVHEDYFYNLLVLSGIHLFEILIAKKFPFYKKMDCRQPWLGNQRSVD